MPSRRFVDRGFWRCRELNRLSSDARLLAIFMFSDEADDFGRLREDNYHLRHCCFPDGAQTEDDVARMVDELVAAEFLAPYFSRAGKSLLWIRRFQDYQPMKYWAASRLDRHPEDEFVVCDTKKDPNTKKHVKVPRTLSPVGHTEAVCDNSAQSGADCAELPQVRTPIPIPIPIPAPLGAPFGQRAETVAVEATNDTTNVASESEYEARAIDKVLTVARREFSVWNGHDPRNRAKATEEATELAQAYDGQVVMLAAIFDAARLTKSKPEKTWRVFRKRLKDPCGGSPDGRGWAKRFTD